MNSFGMNYGLVKIIFIANKNRENRALMLGKKCSSAFKDVICPGSGSCRCDKRDIKNLNSTACCTATGLHFPNVKLFVHFTFVKSDS